MTIAKDIEILQLNVKVAGPKMPPDVQNALKKAIACMTYVLNVKRYPHQADNIPLPAETND